MKRRHFALFCITIFSTCAFAQDFQYKNVVMGVVVQSGITVMEDAPYVESTIKEMVHAIVNNVIYIGSNSTFNNSRVSNISVVDFDLSEDFSSLPEIVFLFSFAPCDYTHELSERVFEHFGPTAHIALTEPGCNRLSKETAITLPLTWFTSTDALYQLLIDIRQRRLLPKWKNANIICDKQTGDGVLDAVLRGLASKSEFKDIPYSIFSVDSMSRAMTLDRQVEEILTKYKGRDSNFVTLTLGRNVGAVLDAAKRVGVLTYGMQYLFITSDGSSSVRGWTDVIRRGINDGVNVALISNHSSLSTDLIGTLFCQVETITTLFLHSIENITDTEFNMFLQVSDEEWELIKPSRKDRTMDIISMVYSNLDTAVLKICEKSSNLWKLEATENGKYGKRVLPVANWNPVTGLQQFDDLFPHVTGGFRGRTIDITSIHYPPWQIFTPDPNDASNTLYSGLIFEVVNHMATTLNFTYKVIPPPYGTWGFLQPDGKWDGMTGMVIENKVVLAAGAFSVNVERSRVVNFTNVLEREAYSFMVNRASELSRVMLFAAPFTLDVWLGLGFAIVIIAPLLYLIHRNSPYYTFNHLDTKHGLFQLKNCYWYLFGAILQQGGTHLPHASSGRLVISFWWILVLIIITTYSGNLVAFLTFPKVESPVNTLDDIINYRGVNSWGFVSDSIIEDYLKSSLKENIKEIYEKGLRHESLNDTVMDQIRFDNHAFIDWKSTLAIAMSDDLKKTGKCDFALGKEEFFDEQIALIVPSTSTYLNLFNNEIKVMLESGMVKNWKSKYWPQKDQCSSTISSVANRTVRISDMQGSFYMLLLGVTISFIVLFIEYLIKRRQKKRLINTVKIIVSSKDTEFWQQKKYPIVN